VLYVLDEPSIGLHQRDNDRLLDDAEEPARSGQHGDRGRT
jgi:excinuclease UvrABC ATPase subunit